MSCCVVSSMCCVVLCCKCVVSRDLLSEGGDSGVGGGVVGEDSKRPSDSHLKRGRGNGVVNKTTT